MIYKADCSLLVVVFWAAVLLCLLALFVNTLVVTIKDKSSKNWISVTGVIDSHIECGAITKCGVKYRYTVNGQSYTNTRIAFVSPTGKGMEKPQKRVWLQEKFPVGATVQVYYVHNDPEKSVLLTGISSVTTLLSTLVACVFIFYILVLEFRVWQKKHKTPT